MSRGRWRSHDDPPAVEAASTASSGLRALLATLLAVRLLVTTLHRAVFPFLPTIARGLGVSVSTLGFLVAVRNLAGVLTPAAVGLARRWGGRSVTVAGLLALGAGAALLAADPGWLLLGLAFLLLGVGKPTFDVGAHGELADRIPYQRRARYQALLEVTWAGGLLVGGPAVAALIAWGGWSTPFAVGAGLAAAGAVAVWRLPPAVVTDGPLAARGAGPVLVVVGTTSLATEMLFVRLGPWLEDLGVGVLAAGGVATLIGLAELTGEGSTSAWADRVGKRRWIAAGLLLATVGFSALVLLPGLVALAALMLALVGFEMSYLAAIPVVSEAAPGARLAQLALLVVVVSVGRAVGAAIAHPLAAAVGFGGLAAVAAALHLLSLWPLRWVREHPGP